jgi:hypothetical protein
MGDELCARLRVRGCDLSKLLRKGLSRAASLFWSSLLLNALVWDWMHRRQMKASCNRVEALSANRMRNGDAPRTVDAMMAASDAAFGVQDRGTSVVYEFSQLRPSGR